MPHSICKVTRGQLSTRTLGNHGKNLVINFDMKQESEKVEESVTAFKDKLIQSVRGQRLLKTMVVLVCTVVVIQQVTASIQKLINIPITTYTHFDFNKTLLYPSVTFCREPPYKYDKMLEYGLYSHPRYTSVWRNFNFSDISLDDLWEDITFNDSDYFVQFGLNGLMESMSLTGWMFVTQSRFDHWTDQDKTWHTNRSCPYFYMFLSYALAVIEGSLRSPERTLGQIDVVHVGATNLHIEDVEVTPTTGFVMGRCYTLSPRSRNSLATKATGYSVTLQHNSRDIATSTGVSPPGYHVYVHYVQEPFTEVEVYNGGLVDYLYASTGETMDVKLTVDEYIKISSVDDPCVYLPNYTANNCTTKYVSTLVEAEAGCSGPWMLSKLPRCDNHLAMTTLITAYMNTYKNHNCSICHRSCRAYLYNAFVTGRQVDVYWDSAHRMWIAKTGEAALQTQIYLHFNAMMVSVYEERYNYDWNLFISDLGGSIGFLLGLSVIGLTSIITQAWFSMVQPLIHKPKRDSSSISSAITADVATVCRDKEFLRKYEEWTKKNNLY